MTSLSDFVFIDGALTPETATLAIAGLFLRVSGFVFLAPILSERFAPAQVRLVSAFALTLAGAPLVPAASPALFETPSAATIFLFSEAICGLIVGFSMRAAIFSLQIAGAIISQHLSLSQLLGVGVALEQETPLATILVMACLALFASSNGLFHLVSALTETYAILPYAGLPGAGDAAGLIVLRVGEAFSMGFRLSAPFIVLGFIYSLTLAAANRAMPQLMAAFVGAPAIIYAGLILFALSAPFIVDRWTQYFGSFFINPLGSLP